MRIKEILSEYGNDFYATYECEHCGHVTPRKSGYHDDNFHNKVIPSKFCFACGKNRAGEMGKATSEGSIFL